MPKLLETPKRDTWNTNPPEVEFQVSSTEVTIVLADVQPVGWDGEDSSEREITFPLSFLKTLIAVSETTQ